METRSRHKRHERTTPSNPPSTSLVSASTLSRSDLPRSTLRRRPSIIDQYARQARTDPDSILEHQNLRDVAHDVYDDDPFPGSIFGITMPSSTMKRKKQARHISTQAAHKSDQSRPRKESFADPPHTQASLPLVAPPTSTPSTGFTISPTSQFSTPPPKSTVTPDTELSARSVRSRDLSPVHYPKDKISTTRRNRILQQEESHDRESMKSRLPRPVQQGSPARAHRTGPSLPTSPSAFLKAGLGQRPVEQDTERYESRDTPIVPPELAHLNVDVITTSPKQVRPRRPSRDGTESLDDYSTTAPVVKSDLSSIYTTYHKRTPSQEDPLLTSSPSVTSRPRFGFSARNDSRERPSPVDSVISPTLSAGAPGSTSAMSGRVGSPMVGPGLGQRKGSRLGYMFSRNRDSPSPAPERSTAMPRKGPAAGTGHEGYGKWGFRGRTPSITGDFNAGRSSSTDSTGSHSIRSFWSRMSRKGSKSRNTASDDESDTADDIFRSNPVSIRGGLRHQDSQDSLTEKLNAPGSSVKVISNFTTSTRLPLTQSGGHPESHVNTPAISEYDAEVGLAESRPNVPSKSVRRSQTLNNIAPLLQPNQIPRPHTAYSPASATSSAHQRSTYQKFTYHKSTYTNNMSDGKEGYYLKSSKPEPAKTKRWNFFQRAHAYSKNLVGNAQSSQDQPRRVPSVHAPLQLAHYMMSGANDQPLDLDDIERSVVVPDTRPAPDFATIQYDAPTKLVPYEERHASLFPFPSNLQRPSLPKIRTDSADSSEILSANIARSSASPQIVDIPRSPMSPSMVRADLKSQALVNAVGEDLQAGEDKSDTRQKSGRSFSRPFARRRASSKSKPEHVKSLPKMPEQRHDSKSAEGPEYSRSKARTFLASPLRRQQQSETTRSGTEFIAFPERKNSELSYTSSSAVTTLSGHTVTAPPVKYWHGDEEIWNEYNELLDQVLPEMTPRSIGSSLGAPFQYDERSNDRQAPEMVQFGEATMNRASKTEVPTSESPYRLSQFLQPAATPSTPYFISDILAGYGDRSSTLVGATLRQRVLPKDRNSRASGYSSLYSRTSAISKHDSIPETAALKPAPTPATHFRDTKLLEMVENPVRASTAIDYELRFGALMTSKWLSFGRVLFSPAHNEANHSESCNILVIDGLGKEWSHYCAMTYPKATFYNLSPDIAKQRESATASQLQQSPNHRHVPHPAIDSPIPFPKGFFSAIVLRFPIATSEAAYHACVFECKRVLRPGGFLEISVLDLDLMNMGNRGRKAVRELKTDIYRNNDQISLRNIGDIMMTFVGKRGFENIQRCVVGIPAAGKITSSQDLSSNVGGNKGKEVTSKTSFAELLYAQPSASKQEAEAENDGITKMVARVGRWWYSTCYETGLELATSSIWEQPGLLRECEKQGTSFRLLLCYAQKPTCSKRRTASV